MTTFPSFDIIDVVPSVDIATGQTLTYAYPAGKTSANYNTAAGAILYTSQSGPLYQGVSGFTIAYGGSIVVTYTGASSLKAGNRVRLQAPLNTYADVGTLDVGASPTQTTINAALNALGARINALQALMRAEGLEPK